MGWVLVVAAAIAGIVLLTGFKRAVIHPGEAGLLYRDGAFVRELGPGAHRWFDLRLRTTVHRVSMLPRALAPAALDVISKDQFAFRIVATPLATVTEARAFHEGTRSAPTVPPSMAAYVPHFADHRRWRPRRCMSSRSSRWRNSSPSRPSRSRLRRRRSPKSCPAPGSTRCWSPR